MTVLYFGDNQAVVGALEINTLIPTLSDGPTILNEVETIVVGNGGNLQDVEIEIEAGLEQQDGSIHIVGLGTADIDGSSYFGNMGAGEVLDFVVHEDNNQDQNNQDQNNQDQNNQDTNPPAPQTQRKDIILLDRKRLMERAILRGHQAQLGKPLILHEFFLV
jgi:hypothetical protein